MKKRITALFLALLLIVSLVPASSAQSEKTYFYVDSIAGNDSNDGKTPETAFATLKRAFSMKFEPGYQILFRRGGTYIGGGSSCGAYISSSGTADNPIVVGAYGEGANPVITTPIEEENVFVMSGSYISISGLDFTAPKGCGVFITAFNGQDVVGISIDSCRMYDISDSTKVESGLGHGGLRVSCDYTARVHDCSFTNLEIFNCHYGINTFGTAYEFATEYYVSPEKSYHYNLLFDNLYIHDIIADGMSLGALYNSTVRNSRLINTAGNIPHAVAPLWLHGCDHVMIEYCEIAGSKNLIDGMAIDFDGWTTNCTYRYIYSHDNNRFMRNCLYDNTTKNRGNTVDHCLSVNDNRFPNSAALILQNTGTLKLTFPFDVGLIMDRFTFTNNVIIGSAPFLFVNLTNANISNNTFVGKSIVSLAASMPFSILSGFCRGTVSNNTYCNFAPIMKGCGNHYTFSPVTAADAFAALFPNGVHTA